MLLAVRAGFLGRYEVVDLSSWKPRAISLKRTRTMRCFDMYRPDPSWFVHKPYGIHGMGHAARVFVWADRIGRRLQESGAILDMEAVRWAAALHDVGRLSDGIDRGHGSRSAAWIADNRRVLPAAISDQTIARILHCCQWHEIGDREIQLMTPELVCIKDADGLDRVRIDDLNPEYLRSSPARLLVAEAWTLFRATAQESDPWNAVFRNAPENGDEAGET
jgi:uncharacterized protein